MPKKAKTSRARVEIRYVDGDTDIVVTRSFSEKVLHWAGARRGWYFLDITGTRRTFLDSRAEDGPHYVIRKMAPSSKTNPN